MKNFRRAERVAPLVMEILADLLQSRARDPRVKLAVLTRVELGDDLRLARVYYHALDGSDHGPIEEGLEAARSFLRRELGQRLRMKFTPDIRFMYDKGLDHADKVERILQSLKEDE